MNRKILVLIIGGIIMCSFFKKVKIEKVIEKTLQNIHSGLKKIKSEFPQLSEIDRAKIKVSRPYYKFYYEKGKNLDAWKLEDLFEKDGYEISVTITYPEFPPEGKPPEPPCFSAEINGKILTGMVVVYTNSQNKESFQNKAGEIIYSGLKEMEKQLNVKFNYFESGFFKIPADEKAKQ